MSEIITIKLSDVVRDGSTQMRTELSEELIKEYMEVIDDLPPAEVIGPKAKPWLVDGWHRTEAQFRVYGPDAVVRVQWVDGSHRDAIWGAVQANHQHGLRRTNADKRKSVATLLSDAEWSLKSSRWLGEAAGVSDKFVANVKKTANTSSGANGSHLTAKNR